MQHIGISNWLPQSFVGRSAGLDFGAFAGTFGGGDFLLIRHDSNPALQVGLEQISSLGRASFAPTSLVPSSTSAFATQVADAVDELPQDGSRSIAQIARRLADWELFVMPLEKRVDNGFPAKISVGRTPNTDVMLRHPTVSQFHAWFYRGDNNELFVRDAGSKNGSLHNGAPLIGPSRARSGDVLRFGRVEVMICSAEVVWSLLSMGSVS